MCGIAGIAVRENARPDQNQLNAMQLAMAHRGPDGDGIHQVQNVALVHTRLAIIDTKNGRQPLVNQWGTALIANAEIYNYIELRATMAATDLTTGSDCEPILPLYTAHGLDFVQHLRGMYAIAVHDPRERRLILVRDPFGIKPLYYAETAQGVAFASEPSVLVKIGWIDAEVNKCALKELLQLRYVTGAKTAFVGIKRVLPGEVLEIIDGRIVSRQRHAALKPFGPKAMSMEMAIAQIDDVIADSIRVHRRSDVPYGMFLSGGVDSCTVLSMMARQMDMPVKAYTAGFPDTSAPDERLQARAVAHFLSAEHVEVEVTAGMFWQYLPRIVAAADDPAADYALIPTYFLAKRARQDVKVVLSGEGGDELLAGYGRYRSAIRSFWRGGRTMRSRGPFDHLGILSLDLRGWRDGLMGAESYCAHPDWSRLQRLQAVDCLDWLPNDLLMKLDRCLMAHGVEGRTPFLDSALAEVMFLLPDALKIHKKVGKYALREWVSRVAPVAQPFAKKQGFTVPIREWMAAKAHDIAPLLAGQTGVAEICQPSGVWRAFSHRNKHCVFAAWTLLFYGLWHQIHIVGVSPTGSVTEVLSAR